MDVELALKINRMVHNECKDVPHDIGLRIEELVRLHQSELKNCSIPDVIGQSELLLAYLKYQNSTDYKPETRIDKEVEKFLSQQ